MRYRPDDAELLDVVASLLEGDVLAALPPTVAHQVRVAASLCRILQRQATLEAPARERERRALIELLGLGEGPQTGLELMALRGELDDRLRDPAGHLDPVRVWEALVAVARDDLAVAKPGYDAWEGG